MGKIVSLYWARKGDVSTVTGDIISIAVSEGKMDMKTGKALGRDVDKLIKKYDKKLKPDRGKV